LKTKHSFALIIFFISVKINAQQYQVPIIDILDSIESKYKVKFAYDPSLLAEFKELYPDMSDSIYLAPLMTALNNVPVEIESYSQLILLLPKQTTKKLELYGKIFDNSNNEPVALASLNILESETFTITDGEGAFLLSTELKLPLTLEVNHLGYHSKRVHLTQENMSDLSVHISPKIKQLKEIIISDDKNRAKKKPNLIFLQKSQLSQRLGLGQPDVFRSVQMLPGIGATNESSASMNVRGSSTTENLVLLDGFTIYHLDHFFGTFSAINSAIVEKVELMKSAYSARWGSRASSILNMSTKTDLPEKINGEFGINLMSAQSMIKVPIKDKTSIVLAARRSFTDLIRTRQFSDMFQVNQYEFLRPEYDEGSNSPNSNFFFYDVNLLARHAFNESNELQASFYKGRDQLQLSDEASTEQAIGQSTFTTERKLRDHNNWGNLGMSLVYRTKWSERIQAEFIASRSVHKNDLHTYISSNSRIGNFNNGGFANSSDQTNKIDEKKIELNSNYRINQRSNLNFGIFYNNTEISYGVSKRMITDHTSISLADDMKFFGVYSEIDLLPKENIELTAGIRLTDCSSCIDKIIEPRISFALSLTDQIQMNASFGKHIQNIVNVEYQYATITGTGFYLLSDDNFLPSIRSDHYTLGGSLSTNNFEFSTEGFFKNTTGISRYNAGFDVYENNLSDGTYFSEGDLLAYGIEIYTQKRTGIHQGSLSYTISQSKNRFEDINEGKYFSSSFDERHELKIANQVSFGSWQFMANWIYGSGRPFSVINIDINVADVRQPLSYYVNLPNANRIPAYHRLDLGATYTITFESQNKLEIGLDIFNAYNRKNFRPANSFAVYPADAQDKSAPTESPTIRLLKFTPSIALTYSF